MGRESEPHADFRKERAIAGRLSGREKMGYPALVLAVAEARSCKTR